MKPRVPPVSPSVPSSPVSSVPVLIHTTSSGSRRRGPLVSLKSTTAGNSSVLSVSTSVASPALKSPTTLAESRSTSTMWLLSCRVTAATLSALMSTDSGSGSLGLMSARPVSATRRLVQRSGFVAEISITTSSPGGPASSSATSPDTKRFSMATAANSPSGLTANPSGSPSKAMVRVIRRVAISITSSWPDRTPLSLNCPSEVSTTTSAKLPTTTTARGSSSSSMRPSGCGAAGSVMSTKPSASSAVSV